VRGSGSIRDRRVIGNLDIENVVHIACCELRKGAGLEANAVQGTINLGKVCLMLLLSFCSKEGVVELRPIVSSM